MNVFLAVIQLLTIILICIFEYKKRYISVFLWATLLILFGIPHFISIVISTNQYDSNIMIQASFFVILFNSIYLVTKFSIPKMLSCTNTKSNGKLIDIQSYENIILNSKEKYLANLLFVLFVSSFIILIGFTINHIGNLANVSWGTFYNLNKDLGLSSPLRYATQLFFATAGVALVYKSQAKFKFIISIVIILAFVLITGNRITILPLLIVLIIPMSFGKYQRINFLKANLFLLLGLSIIYLVYLLRLLRIDGGIYNFINNFNLVEVNNRVINMIFNGDGELSLRNAFYYFIEINNNFPGFNEAHTYFRLLLIAIPTKLSFGFKPPDFAITMGSAWTNNLFNTTYSMHPTLYGDVFANLWWFGIILGGFWAVLTYFIEILINRRNRVLKLCLYVLFGTVYVIVARGSVYNGLFIGFTGSIIISIIYFLSKFKVRIRL